MQGWGLEPGYCIRFRWVLGVVLAGGASKRMGRDKALVELGGRPMVSWVVEALEKVCERVVIAGRGMGWGGRLGLADPSGIKGPLAGLVAALGMGEDLLLLGVDQPWVRMETLEYLAGLEGTVVPIDRGVRQVTCARYSVDLAAAALGAASVQALLDTVQHHPIEEEEWRSWDEDGRSWFSVDDKAALTEGLDRYGPPGRDSST